MNKVITAWGASTLSIWGVWMMMEHSERAQNNLEQLIWMQNHQYENSKSKEEERLIKTTICEHKEYFKSRNPLKRIWGPPTVDWASLPMDDEFLKKFY